MLKITIRLKGGAGSGHHGHAGRPGDVGGSVPGAKLIRALGRAAKASKKDGRFSSGHVGKANVGALVDGGYIKPFQGDHPVYFEVTDKGVALLKDSAPSVPPEKAKPQREYVWQDLLGQRKLSGVKAEALAKGLPGGHDLDVERNQSMGRNSRGQKLAATYYGGLMRLSSGVSARTVVHEVGHHVWDTKVHTAKAQRSVLTAFEQLRSMDTMELLRNGYRPHSLRRGGHEFFADSYAMWFNGGKIGRAKLTKVFPDVANIMGSIERGDEV